MTVPLRAALYLRVSTARQAEHDVSIPDQKRQGEAYCPSRGYIQRPISCQRPFSVSRMAPLNPLKQKEKRPCQAPQIRFANGHWRSESPTSN